MHQHLARLRTWDPTHPVWVGTYLGYFLDRVEGTPGCLAYYDYHWSRGLNFNYNTLTALHQLCSRRADHFGRWIHIDPDIRKSLYTINTTIAHGGKTMIWFIGGAVNPQTGELNENHEHLRVHRELRNMYRQIAELGKPLAVYSTETTRTMDDRPKDRDVPRPLPGFPEKHWAQVESGEAMVGFFQHGDGGDMLFVANHNAFAPQKMKLRIARDGQLRVRMFDRSQGGWKDLEVRDQAVEFDLAPAAGELIGIDN